MCTSRRYFKDRRIERNRVGVLRGGLLGRGSLERNVWSVGGVGKVDAAFAGRRCQTMGRRHRSNGSGRRDRLGLTVPIFASAIGLRCHDGLRPWVAELSQDPACSPLAVNAHDTLPPAYDSWLCLADSLVCLFYRQRIWPIACEATQAPSFEALSTMSIVPALEVPLATAQSIVDRVLAGQQVTDVCNIHGGEIAAVYKITFEGPHPQVVLKIYPDTLHWKMRKEANVISLVQSQLSVPMPRILLADDSKQIIALNFILMTKLDGEILAGLEPVLTSDELLSSYSQIGKLLHELHSLSMNAFGYIGANGIVT